MRKGPSRFVSDRYGGKKDMLRIFLGRARLALGGYGEYRSIRWGDVERLVFVCTGNICRSPYAEFRARQLGVSAISCGIHANNAGEPNADAVRNARRRGIDFAEARSRPAARSIFLPGDLVLAMEPWQGLEVSSRLPNGAQLTLTGLWSAPATPWIPDPYGRSDAYFQRCFDVIDHAVSEVQARMGRDFPLPEQPMTRARR